MLAQTLFLYKNCNFAGQDWTSQQSAVAQWTLQTYHEIPYTKLILQMYVIVCKVKGSLSTGALLLAITL